MASGEEILGTVLGGAHLAGKIVLGALGGPVGQQIGDATEALLAANTPLPDWALTDKRREERKAAAAAAAAGQAPPFSAAAWPIQIVQPHALSPAEARARVDALAARVAPEYSITYRWTSPTEATWERSGAQGGLLLTPSEIRVGMKLGILLGLAQGRITDRVAELLREAVGASSVPPPAPTLPGGSPIGVLDRPRWYAIASGQDPALGRRVILTLRGSSAAQTGVSMPQALRIAAVPYADAGLPLPSDPEDAALEIEHYLRGKPTSFGRRGSAAEAAPSPSAPTPASAAPSSGRWNGREAW